MCNSSGMPEIVLKSMTTQDAQGIWLNGHRDPAWPETSRTLRGFQTLVADWQAAEVMGWGWVRAVHLYSYDSKTSTVKAQRALAETSHVIGFVTFHELDESWTDVLHKAIECGTYVVPTFRGLGLNRLIKAASVTFGLTALGADSILYAVPVSNHSALRSLKRILGETKAADKTGTEVTATEAGAEKANTVLAESRFQKWLQYREWKEGKSFHLFIIDLESAKACNLLNPDGNHSHLIRE